MNRLVLSVAGLVVIVTLAGCPDSDARLGELASQVTHEQAEQNQRIAEASKAVAQGSQQLVKGDADARRDLISLQQDLRQDQAQVAQQRDALEAERKAIAQQRRTESTLGSVLLTLGIVLACLSPLVLAGFCLLGLWREPTKEEEGHVLIEVLVENLGENDEAHALKLGHSQPPSPRPPTAQASDPP